VRRTHCRNSARIGLAIGIRDRDGAAFQTIAMHARIQMLPDVIIDGNNQVFRTTSRDTDVPVQDLIARVGAESSITATRQWCCASDKLVGA